MKVWYFLDANSGRCLSDLFVRDEDEVLYQQLASYIYTNVPKLECSKGFEAHFVNGAWSCVRVT
jgi:hypothetical protein